MLSTETWPTWAGPHQDGAQLILDVIKLEKDQYCFGNGKIFIRSPTTVSSDSLVSFTKLYKLARNITGNRASKRRMGSFACLLLY